MRVLEEKSELQLKLAKKCVVLKTAINTLENANKMDLKAISKELSSNVSALNDLKKEVYLEQLNNALDELLTD